MTAPGRGIRSSMVAGQTLASPRPGVLRSSRMRWRRDIRPGRTAARRASPGAAHAFERDIRPTQQQRAIDAVEAARAGRETDALVDVGRVDHLAGTELLGEVAL